MGNFNDHIPDNILLWVREQPVFWIATSPLSKDSHINVSPKGTRQSYFHVEPKKLVYEDMTGSGVETIAHIRDNGRITILFQAFEGPPRLCRIYGKAAYHEYGSPEYDEYIKPEKRASGSRAVIIVDITKVGGSCGFGVPLYKYISDRPTLQNWSSVLEKPTAAPGKTMHDWWTRECSYSLDGLPALSTALTTIGKPFKNTWIMPDVKKKNPKDTSMEEYRLLKTGGKPLSGGTAQQQVGKVKSAVSFFDERLLVGLIAGLAISALLNLAGIPLA